MRAGLSQRDDETAIERRMRMWNSDEESSSDLENEDMRTAVYRQILYQGADDDRSVAAMRGALANSKKLPTKEALASLEKVKLEDLADSDKGK